MLPFTPSPPTARGRTRAQVYSALWASAQPEANQMNAQRVDAAFAESLLPMRAVPAQSRL